MNINTTTLKNFRNDFENAVKALSEKYNVEISLGNINYTSDKFSSKLSAANKDDSVDKEKRDFESVCGAYAFKPGDYNSNIMIRGKEFRFVGFNTNAPKNCCKIVSRDGNTYTTSLSTVKRALNNVD